MAEYYFNLPPITQLTIHQQAALNETNAIALSGGPGTGKSVVSLWRHISNHQRGKKSQLLTYTTTLAKYLEMCSKSQNANAGNNVNSSLRWMISPHSFEEIIIDEAQDLHQGYYHKLKNYSNLISYGADDSQILYPENSTKQKELKELFPNNKLCPLSKNFRSTQSIMRFAKNVFSEAFIPQSTIDSLGNNIGDLPIMLISGGSKFEMSNDKQDFSIKDIINTFNADTHNIAVLVAWKNEVKYFYNFLKNDFNCSRYYEDKKDFPDGCAEIKNIHITTYKSAKGLEFDTVIVPSFDKYHFSVPIIFKHKETEKDTVMCTWSDLYVAVTRARSNLYLITNNDMPFLNLVTDKQRL